MGIGCLAYSAVLIVSFLGGPSTAPVTLIPDTVAATEGAAPDASATAR